MGETKTFRLAVIPGDGIGKEVVRECMRVLEHMAEESDGKFAFDSDYFPWGCEYYLENGKMVAEDGLEQIRKHDAIYFGDLGGTYDTVEVTDAIIHNLVKVNASAH